MSRPLRILFVVTRSDSIGGASVHVRDLSRALIEDGHEVLVGVGGSGPFTDDLARNGVPLRVVPSLMRPVRPRSDLRALLELLRLIRSYDPDVISLHTAKAGWLGRVAATLCRVPVIYTAHGWPFTPGVPTRDAWLYGLAERATAPLATAIIDVCRAERDVALRRRVGRPGQHRVIHNGMPDVQPEFIADPGKSPPRIAMVARFEAPKEQFALIDALCELRELDWYLDLVGDGPARPAVEEQARESGVGDRIAFHGSLADVRGVLASAQIFALTTRWEGFPRSVIEAMRAGLPVVASNVGGIHEAVVAGENGFLIERGDRPALVEALRRLISDPELRTSFGADSREKYERGFTFERMFRGTVDIYRELAGQRGSAAGGRREIA